MFDSLSDKLQDIIAKTAGQKELTQENMQEALREIRRALLEADVNLRVVKAFISNIKDKAEGENVLQGVNPSQQLVKIVHDELITLLGSEKLENFVHKISVVNCGLCNNNHAQNAAGTSGRYDFMPGGICQAD